MKALLLFISLVICKVLPAQYIFNFGGGKSGLWSNPANWVGGMVPPNDLSTVSVIPPDNSDGWLCQLDQNGVICRNKLVVGSNAKFSILPGNTINCYDSIKIQNNGALNVEGKINIFCPTVILNNGTITIATGGSISSDPSSECFFPDLSSFLNYGPLYVNGSIIIDGCVMKCYDFFWNKGVIQLFNHSQLESTNFLRNDGTIAGGITFSTENMVNNGTIELTGTGDNAVNYSSHNSLLNFGDISMDATLYLKGTVVNYQSISALTPVNCNLDTVQFTNFGRFFLEESSTARLVGNLYNKGTFDYQYIMNPTNVEMEIINDGEFISGTTTFVSRSVINNGNMTLNAYSDSNHIKVPFINRGVLTSNGPVSFNDAFINSGDLHIVE